MEKILAFVRTLIIAIGAFFVGRSFFGHTVTVDNWQVWVGALMIIIGGIWSWVRKELPEDQKISLIRTILASVGAVVIASGKVDELVWTNIVGVVIILAQFFIGQMIKTKDNKVANGLIAKDSLRK